MPAPTEKWNNSDHEIVSNNPGTGSSKNAAAPQPKQTTKGVEVKNIYFHLRNPGFRPIGR